MYGSASLLLPDLVISLCKRVEETIDVTPNVPQKKCGPEVLDVGVGFGVLAMGFRQRLLDDQRWYSDIALARYDEDLRNDVEIFTNPVNWWAPIDGIEGNEQHCSFNGVHSYFYRQVEYKDVFDALADIGDAQYDVVVASDILEHFGKEEVPGLLAELERVSRHYVVIALPCTAFTPCFVTGSPLETHRTHIDQSFLIARGYNLAHQDIDGYVAIRSLIAETLPDQGVLR